jgi:dTDP-4-dehydrorhamnose 3,5-epimerase
MKHNGILVHNSIEIKGVEIFENKVFDDERGYFLEWFRFSKIRKSMNQDFLSFSQANFSFSNKGVVRGLHVSTEKQYKLVTIASGAIFDTLLDLRIKSNTYLKHTSIEIDSKNPISILIPPGVAHGFSALSDNVRVMYLVSTEYDPKNEIGLDPMDQDLQIDWQVSNPILSLKDKHGIALRDFKSKSIEFTY